MTDSQRMNLGDLSTEGRNPNSVNLDRLSANEIVRLMNDEDATISAAVAAVADQIAVAMDVIAQRFRSGGRLIYIGAGTSGRLGVLDAAECPPTFSSPPWQVVGLIAGGNTALTRAIEGAEDHEPLGEQDLRRVECSANDVVVGIATSGRTPYVIGGMKYARQIGAAVIALSCNPESPLKALCDIEIAPIVGPEVVTGSTRLKAGTATKLVLNTLTTGAMVLLGKTYGNLMVDLQATNEKLADRSERIVAELASVSRSQAGELLKDCDGEVKTAIVSHLKELTAEQARFQLRRTQGHLRNAIEADVVPTSIKTERTDGAVVLGVDGGGTKTRAWLAPLDAQTTEPAGIGEAGTCNPQSVGWTAALANINHAVSRACAEAGVDRHDIAAACLAIAGTGSPRDQHRLRDWAQRQRLANELVITHDAMPILTQGTTEGVGIALIAGTGSLAFGQNADGETARAGGWGHVIGDEGSGYDVACQGLRAVSRHHDGTGPETSLTAFLCRELGIESAVDIRHFLADEDTDVRTIARLAPHVIAAAEAGDDVASQIVNDAAEQLALLVQSVAIKLWGEKPSIELAMAGGVLAHASILRDSLLQKLTDHGIRLHRTEVVAEPVRGTILLARAAMRSPDSAATK